MGARELLTFDEASHVYRFMGDVVPGVTQVLKPLCNFDRVPREVLEAKAELGRQVHYACQLLDEDDLDEDSVTEEIEPYLQAWRQFRLDTGCQVLAIEKRVFEPMFLYAGTLDRVLAFKGAKWLVDLKTCFTTPMAAGPQTAAYLRALGDTSVTHRAALRLRPDGTYRFDPLTGADDWSAFMAALTLHRFKEAHSNEH